MAFDNDTAGADINTAESTWRCIKASQKLYNIRETRYSTQKNIGAFCKFIGLIVRINCIMILEDENGWNVFIEQGGTEGTWQCETCFQNES